MDKQYYVLHWNDYWQSYAHLNPDLALNNITSKRALMNHFITCGYKENRKIIQPKRYLRGGKVRKGRRRTYIKKEDVKKYGMTEGCEGCKAANRGSKAVGHTEECRSRMEKSAGRG